MKAKRLFTITLTLAFFVSMSVFSQSPKKLVKNGLKQLNAGQVQVAIDLFSQAITLDSTYAPAYYNRAKVNAKSAKYEEAKMDFEQALKYNKSNTDIYVAYGRTLYKLQDYEKSVMMLTKALSLSKKNTSALKNIIYGYVHLKKFDKAIGYCNVLLNIDKSYYNYYIRGVVYDSLKNYTSAKMDYTMSLSYNDKYAKTYYGLAKLLLKTDNALEALNYANKVLTFTPNVATGYWIRSEANYKLKNYDNAISDLSKINTLTPDDENVYFTRGLYYREYSQQQNAINDFSKVIKLNPDNYKAFYYRALLYDDISNKEDAINDYEHIVSTEVPDSILSYSKERLYDLKRESNKPKLTITSPFPKDKYNLVIKDDVEYLTITGEIDDESDIEFVKVNDHSLKLHKDEHGKTIVNDSIEIIGLKNITFLVSDIYHNEKDFKFNLARTETDAPVVTLITPYASYDGEIYLNSNDPKLYIEGSVSDESLIKSIYIGDVIGSYRRDELNPTFSATIDILNINTIEIKTVDIHDNQSITKFTFNREGIEINANNPMGKTWIVFINNSNYESFASLEGPTKDVSSMKGAFANYQINNIIHKKDMTKMQMEKFFSIDLRDLIKDNHVNSLLVWYAGHGKYINETGYWIPVNAVRDDEFTYFNINSLKASMESYSKYITHVLIVTDACESGPSFYQAMRSAPEERSCSDINATKFKSSQVFSSAGYELASDNSQFTKTFAKTLIYNTNSCIPIEDIVSKVTEAVAKNNSQKPQFGKIQGFEDENGTFFFMHKE